jgi:hypothetical protein
VIPACTRREQRACVRGARVYEPQQHPFSSKPSISRTRFDTTGLLRVTDTAIRRYSIRISKLRGLGNRRFNGSDFHFNFSHVAARRIKSQTFVGRSNVPGITKKDRPLTGQHFAEFEKAYGKDPNGLSKRVDGGELGRLHRFHISEIKERGYKLDVTWLKDDSLENPDELPEPQDLAAEAIVEIDDPPLSAEDEALQLTKKTFPVRFRGGV